MDKAPDPELLAEAEGLADELLGPAVDLDGKPTSDSDAD